MSITTFKTKRHDTGSSPEVLFTPAGNTAFDLSETGISAKFVARLPGSASPKIAAAAVVTGPWSVRYDPIPADVDTIGAYDVEVEITRANGKKITLPNVNPGEPGAIVWIINADLDNA